MILHICTLSQTPVNEPSNIFIFSDEFSLTENVIWCFQILVRFHTLVVDGHDVEALARAFYEAQNTKGRPTAVIAKTFKGKGIPGQYSD